MLLLLLLQCAAIARVSLQSRVARATTSE